MTDQEIRLKFGEMNAGEMSLARALVEWHEREIASLKAERDKLDASLTEVVEAAEKAGWNGVENSKHLPTYIADLAEDLLAQAVRRMEAVPVRELWDIYRHDGSSFATDSMGAVRARLIAAARCEGQAMTKNVPGDKCPACGAEEVEANTPRTTYACGSSDYDGRPDTFHPGDKCEAPPVVVNEPPQDEKQPDLSGESEKQTEEPAWIPHDGGPCPLKDDEVEEWSLRRRDGYIASLKVWRPCELRWKHIGNSGDIIAYRVLRWKPGFGLEAKPDPAQAQQVESQAWTPAVGDTVRLKSGGPVMTVTDVDPLSLMCAWMNANNELQVEPITTLCLTPAQS